MMNNTRLAEIYVSSKASQILETQQIPLELQVFSKKQSSQDKHLAYSKQQPFPHVVHSSKVVHVQQLLHYLQRPFSLKVPSLQVKQLMPEVQSKQSFWQGMQSESFIDKNKPFWQDVHPRSSTQVLHQLAQKTHLLPLRYLLMRQLKHLSPQQDIHPLGHALHLQSVRQQRLVQQKHCQPEQSRQLLVQGRHHPPDTPY